MVMGFRVACMGDAHEARIRGAISHLDLRAGLGLVPQGAFREGEIDRERERKGPVRSRSPVRAERGTHPPTPQSLFFLLHLGLSAVSSWGINSAFHLGITEGANFGISFGINLGINWGINLEIDLGIT